MQITIQDLKEYKEAKELELVELSQKVNEKEKAVELQVKEFEEQLKKSLVTPLLEKVNDLKVEVRVVDGLINKFSDDVVPVVQEENKEEL